MRPKVLRFPRIAVVTDIHHGEDTSSVRGTAAIELLRDVVTKVNQGNYDLFVDLGDRIWDRDREADLRSTRRVSEVLGGLNVPRVHLIGNHDVVNADPAALETVLGAPLRSHSIDLHGWHLVFWYVTAAATPEGFALAKKDIEWLADDFARNPLPAVVFTHIPLGENTMKGNYNYERLHRGLATFRNAEVAREILCEHGQAVIAVAGHQHWDTLSTLHGVHYVTLQSLTNTRAGHPEPAGAWATLNLGDPSSLEVHGRERRNHSLSVGREAGCWPSRWTPRSLAPLADETILADIEGVIVELESFLPDHTDSLAALVAWLQATGSKVVVTTNDSSHSPRWWQTELSDVGIELDHDSIITSGYAAVHMIGDCYRGATVYPLGEFALAEHLTQFSIKQADANGPADIVLVGAGAGLDRQRLSHATDLVRGGAELVATSRNALNLVHSTPKPDAGIVLEQLEAAGSRIAAVVGHPYPRLALLALERLGLGAERTLLVGGPELDPDLIADFAPQLRASLILPEWALTSVVQTKAVAFNNLDQLLAAFQRQSTLSAPEEAHRRL